MIDLHTHTKASDGEKTPKELIDLALELNIKALAITDHDTIDGISPAVSYSQNKNILLIPGIELEAKVDNGQMHILGLFIDYSNKNFIEKLNNIRNSRENRNLKFIDEFKKLGFDISIDELKKISGGKTIGKPHFAKVFLNKNYIQNKCEIFDKYFNQPPFNKLEKNVYSPKDIITMIKEANGIAVLAHPQSLKLSIDELTKTLIELKSYGLDGLECIHSNQSSDEMLAFKNLAKSLNLIITKGSDYHGPIVKPDIKLGTGINGNIISNEEDIILETLLKYVNT